MLFLYAIVLPILIMYLLMILGIWKNNDERTDGNEW